MQFKTLAQKWSRRMPGRKSATIVLNPDGASPTTVIVSNAWAKPASARLQDYGHLNVQGDETVLHIPDIEFNPANNGREIRTRDQITFDGTTYIVIQAGTTLKTVKTCWVCVCRKVLA